MAQLSLFSADARPVRRADLAGLLCGPARIVRFGSGTTARLSVELPDPARAAAVRAATAATGIRLEPDGAGSLRSAFRCDLVALAAAWSDGDGKAVPDDLQLDGALLRLWAIAAGRGDERGGYLLALDPQAPHTHRAIVAAACRAGISPARVGDATAPALRIAGARRVQRLVELVGPAPERVARVDWPHFGGRPDS